MDDEQYHQRLAHNVAAWQREGLVTEGQARAILEREGADAVKVARALRLGWFATAVSVAGAIVLAAGIVLLFAANWDATPSWFRVSAVFTGMAFDAGRAVS